MATTPNFNWSTPDNTGLVKNGALDIRTLGDSIDASLVDLKGGTTNQVLAKNSNTDMDFKWVADAAGTSFSPNLCINGAFVINQRSYVSGASLSSGAYGLDRWKATTASTSLTFTANPNNTQVTISSGGSIEQVIERENVPAGTYTLSWSGTATARVYNTGGTPPAYAASPVTFTADGLANVEIEFTASGGTRTLSLVKFERGSAATTYSLAGNTFAGELAACQRYYYRATPANSYHSFGSAFSNSTTTMLGAVVFPVTMRIAPTALEQRGTASEYGIQQGGTGITCSAVPSFSNGTTYNSVVTFTVASGLTAGSAGLLRSENNSTAYLAWSAEL